MQDRMKFYIRRSYLIPSCKSTMQDGKKNGENNNKKIKKTEIRKYNKLIAYWKKVLLAWIFLLTFAKLGNVPVYNVESKQTLFMEEKTQVEYSRFYQGFNCSYTGEHRSNGANTLIKFVFLEIDNIHIYRITVLELVSADLIPVKLITNMNRYLSQANFANRRFSFANR